MDKKTQKKHKQVMFQLLGVSALLKSLERNGPVSIKQGTYLHFID